MMNFVKYLFANEKTDLTTSDGNEEEVLGRNSDYLPINDLPDEILVEIFEYLEKEEQNACKLVCHRFLNVFNTYASLRGNLVIRNCVLARNQPPVLTFLQTFHPLGFKSICGMNDVYWNFENKNGDIDDFWELLAPTLAEYCLPDYLLMNEKEMHISFNVVGKFSKLNKLTINKFCLAELQRSDKIRQKLNYPWIKRVKLICLNLDLPYDWIFDVFPNLSGIELEEFRATDEKNAIIFFEKYGTLITGIKKEQIPPSIYSTEMNLKHLNTSIYSVDEFNSFYDFINGQQCIQDISLEMNFKKLAFQNLNSLKKLKVNFVDWVCTSFEPFNDFPQLRELDCYFGYKLDSEFFGHKILKNNNMKAVALHTRKIQLCPFCYKTMLISYENLRSIHIYTYTLVEYAEELFGLFGKYGTNLKKITIRAAKKFSLRGSFGYASYMYNLPLLCQLKEIEIMPVGKISERWVQTLCRQCPNLEHISLYDSLNLNSHMIKIFFTDVKNLKSLTLANRRKETKGFHFSLESVYKYCGQLQKLRLLCCNLDCDKMMKLYELSDKLEIVQDNNASINRTDYYLNLNQ